MRPRSLDQVLNTEPGSNRAMESLDEARREWQAAQAELQKHLAELERLVATAEDAATVLKARDSSRRMQRTADDLLNRYITLTAKLG